MAAAFDDVKVAQLLATALALEGQASDRLATIFDTIAPDEDRKQRVLTLTRSLLSETDFGKSGQFQMLWTSTEELLVSYNDKPFVSETYRCALDGVGGRAERWRPRLPPELLRVAWRAWARRACARSRYAADRSADDRSRREARRGNRRGHGRARRGLLMAGAYDGHRWSRRALSARAGSTPKRSAATPAARRSTVGEASRCARRRRSLAFSTRRTGSR